MRWLILVFIGAMICAGEASSTELARKKSGLFHYYYQDLIFKSALVSFFTFVAIKVKIIIVVFAVMTGILIATKLWIAVKYGGALLHHEHHGGGGHSDVVYHNPGPSYGGGGIEYSSPPVFSGDTFGADSGGFEQFSSHPPSGGPPEGPPETFDHHGRSIGNETGFIDDIIAIKNMVKRVDITELSFNAMNLTQDCRRRFVCEADQQAKSNPLMHFALTFFSNDGLKKYRSPSVIVRTIKDCTVLYPGCSDDKVTYEDTVNGT